MNSELDTINDKNFRRLLQPMKVKGFNDEKIIKNKDYDQLSIYLHFIDRINETFAGSLVTNYPTFSMDVENYCVHDNKALYNFKFKDLAVLLKVSERNAIKKLCKSKSFTILWGIESTLLIGNKIWKHNNLIKIRPSVDSADLTCSVGYYIVQNNE